MEVVKYILKCLHLYIGARCRASYSGVGASRDRCGGHTCRVLTGTGKAASLQARAPAVRVCKEEPVFPVTSRTPALPCGVIVCR